MGRDFKNELAAEKFQIFVPKIFLSEFPKVVDYDQYIKKVEELKVIKDINELSEKITNEKDSEKKERFNKKLDKAKNSLMQNEFYTDLKILSEDEIKMVNNLQKVKGKTNIILLRISTY